MKALGEKLREWGRLLIHSGLGPVLIFSVLITLTIRFHGDTVPKLFYKVGDIAHEDIYAPRDMSIVDEESTLKRRKESSDNVRSVYDYNHRENQRVLERLQQAFEVAQRTLTEKGQQADLKNTVRRKFEDTLGVQMTGDEFKVLWSGGFSKAQEFAIRNLLLTATRSLNIVSSRELLSPDMSRGISRRTIEINGVTSEEALDDFSEIYDLDDVRLMMKNQFQSTLGRGLTYSKNEILNLAQKLVRPTLTFNQAETENRRQAAFDSEHNVVPIVVRKGAIIIRAGSVFEPRHLTIINGITQERRLNNDGLVLAGVFLLCVLVISVIHRYSSQFRSFQLTTKDFYLMATSILFIFLISRLMVNVAVSLSKTSGHVEPVSFHYILPLCTVAMLTRMVIGSEIALLVSILMAFLGALFLDNSIYFGAYFFISCIYAAREIPSVKKRADLFRVGLLVGAVNAVTAGVLTLIIIFSQPVSGPVGQTILWNILFAMSGGILSSFLLMLMTMLAESLFNYTTNFKLLELGDQNSPLLRELMVQAPGTYHHSIIVGTLSEAAASSIGENGLLARVACLYHDIGKTKKPLYYVENQAQRENRHDKLTPRMSARVIQAHVKDGIEMAREAKLPQEIIDMIPQHHGTRLISFFYDKAKAQSDPEMETIEEKDFRYEGPKPQSRVAGILLLADGLEAITRTLDDPTPARIKGVVRDHINKIFSEGELDETELTLRDLSAIANAFTRVLTSFFHHRIDYPTAVGKDTPTRLRKIHDHQDSKSPAKDAPRSQEGEGGYPNDTPRLKIT